MEKQSREGFIEELEAKQQNILWEDQVENARNVDALLWRGSKRTTVVQRIGIGLFSILFLYMGAFLLLDSISSKEFLGIPIAIALIALGLKVGYNAVKPNRRPS